MQERKTKEGIEGERDGVPRGLGEPIRAAAGIFAMCYAIGKDICAKYIKRTEEIGENALFTLLQ